MCMLQRHITYYRIRDIYAVREACPCLVKSCSFEKLHTWMTSIPPRGDALFPETAAWQTCPFQCLTQAAFLPVFVLFLLGSSMQWWAGVLPFLFLSPSGRCFQKVGRRERRKEEKAVACSPCPVMSLSLFLASLPPCRLCVLFLLLVWFLDDIWGCLNMRWCSALPNASFYLSRIIMVGRCLVCFFSQNTRHTQGEKEETPVFGRWLG